MTSVPHEAKTGVVGYISVPAKFVQAVLQDGYQCSQARDHVPISFNPLRAASVRNGNQYNAPEAVSLEVYNISTQLRDALDREKGHFRNIKHLPAKYLRRGGGITRDVGDYVGVPCPLCGQPMVGLEAQRAEVGVYKTIGDCFMVVPCPNAACIQKIQERQARLKDGLVMELYHTTSRDKSKLIFDSGGKLLRGSQGLVGGGAYLAHTARETEWKQESGTDVVVLKCLVQMGRPIEMTRAAANYKNIMFKDLVKPLADGSYTVEQYRCPHAKYPKKGPYDSVIIDRGDTKYPVPKAPVFGTRVEDCPKGTKMHPGYEFVVYSWDQVTVLGEVPRDKVP